MGAKMNVSPDSLAVKIRWRGECADVQTKAVPKPAGAYAERSGGAMSRSVLTKHFLAEFTANGITKLRAKEIRL